MLNLERCNGKCWPLSKILSPPLHDTLNEKNTLFRMNKVFFSLPSSANFTTPRPDERINTFLVLCALAYVTVSLTAIVGNIYGLIKIMRIIKVGLC